MKFLKQPKIEKKTRQQIEEEIDFSISSKDQSQRGKMLKRARMALLAFYPEAKIRQMFIDEYIKKYGELESGKTSLKKMGKESLANSKLLSDL